MNIEKRNDGSYLIEKRRNGDLFKRIYYGYTKKEAISCFRHDYKTCSK